MSIVLIIGIIMTLLGLSTEYKNDKGSKTLAIIGLFITMIAVIGLFFIGKL